MALAARLVEVIADRGAAAARYRYGSGCIVQGRTVLTAAHVVAGAVSVQAWTQTRRCTRPPWIPALWGCQCPGPDLALVEIDDPAIDLPPIGLAWVDREGPTDEPVECRAVGYPWFAETPSPAAERDTVDAIGVVPVLSKLAAGLSVQCRWPRGRCHPRTGAWRSRSGPDVRRPGGGGRSAAWGGNCARAAGGAVSDHGRPLTALEPDPAHPRWGPGVKDAAAWWARLGVTGLADRQRLPAPIERPDGVKPSCFLPTSGTLLEEKMQSSGWLPRLDGR